MEFQHIIIIEGTLYRGLEGSYKKYNIILRIPISFLCFQSECFLKYILLIQSLSLRWKNPIYKGKQETLTSEIVSVLFTSCGRNFSYKVFIQIWNKNVLLRRIIFPCGVFFRCNLGLLRFYIHQCKTKKAGYLLMGSRRL